MTALTTSPLADQHPSPATRPTPPLRLGPFEVDPPVVLAPMAGVTNAAFRRLCAEQARAVKGRTGLYVCEMITSRGVVEGDAKTLGMLVFDPFEEVRSVQLYGVDPRVVAEAVRILAGEHGVGHVDLNFGCPVPKVTRRGGGAALPWKRTRLAAILEHAVQAAAPYGLPVTIKTRKGIDEEHLTYRDAGRIAEEAGCAAVALHGRTAAQHYSGQADWDAIADLKASVGIPVLGNGDIWEAGDALRMVVRTGADGVVVGRGCLGRPWLFRDLAAAFAGAGGHASTQTSIPTTASTPTTAPTPATALTPATTPAPPLPALGEVAATLRRHGELLAELMGEDRGLRDLRKHVAWYLKGFMVGQETRAGLGMVSSFDELDRLLARLEPDQPFPRGELGRPRGRQGSARRVSLPEGWLADTDGHGDDFAAAELDASGG